MSMKQPVHLREFRLSSNELCSFGDGREIKLDGELFEISAYACQSLILFTYE